MADNCVLYYITDRTQFPGDESSRRRQLLEKIAEAARCCVDFIQLREKDLCSRELERLASGALRTIRQHAPITRDPRPQTRLLINSRSDIALAVGADGVHLRSDDISVVDARGIAAAVHAQNRSNLHADNSVFSASSANSAAKRLSRDPRTTVQNWTIAVSCHSEEDVRRAAATHADFAVFAPVFEKKSYPEATPTGLAALRHACTHGIPVLALGGVSAQNAVPCIAAGAAGIAAIRLFQENPIADVVRQIPRYL